MQIKNGIEYHSLYEYLGYAAGPNLGNRVNKAAIKINQEYITQEVDNPMFKGEVFCYTKEFLNEYFANQYKSINKDIA